MHTNARPASAGSFMLSCLGPVEVETRRGQLA